MNRKLESDVAASDVSNADEFAQIVMPRHLRRKKANSSPPWLMWLLAVVAVVLMGIGVAAPQVTYALDADRYDEYVDELRGLRAELVDEAVQVQAEELLLAEQGKEAHMIASRVKKLGAADPAVLREEDAKALTAAGEHLASIIPDEAGGPTTPEQKRLEKALADGRVNSPISWFGMSNAELIALAGLEPEDPRPVESEKTVSLDALEDVRRWVKDDRKELEALRARATELRTKSDEMLADSDKNLGIVRTAAEGLPQTAEELLVLLPNIEPEQLDEMLAAADDAAEVARSESFVRFADGKTLARSMVEGEIPADAAEVRPSPAVRSRLTLYWFETYLEFATAALQEQRDYEELVAEEEPPPEETTQPETEDPAVVDPPVVEPPVVEPPVVEPPVVEPPDTTTPEGSTDPSSGDETPAL